MRLRQRSRAALTAAVSFLRAEVGLEELLIAAALLLLVQGFSMVWPPGMYLAPGAVLLWIGLPQRSSFIHRPPLVKRSRKDA